MKTPQSTVRKSLKDKRSQFEFIALMALLMSMVALSIDALLPALGIIGETLAVGDSNDTQLLVTMMFLGIGLGQLLSGPLSDSFGRKPIMYLGFSLFFVASLVCTEASSMEVMVMGRILQGFGLSAPRTISMAIVRDSYTGERMAKIMSFITVIFILVPAIAPTLGKFSLDLWGWRSIFYVQGIIALVVVIWFGIRQPETLQKDDRVAFGFKKYRDGIFFFLQNKQALHYTIIVGFISGAFLSFLSAAQKVLGSFYGLEDTFPYLFAMIALCVGLSTFINGFVVMRVGMRKLVRWSSLWFMSLPIMYVLLFREQPQVPIEILMGFLCLQFLSLGFLFGNLSALAMEPLGKIAGLGAAFYGFLSTLIAVPIAFVIGNRLETTVLPLFIGISCCGILAFVWIRMVQGR
ncbi:MAG: multidrug effflux MFS transporter [Flavobacteriaceae bacterium]|nr:multidrug effflux MFS transporter [Flavobacteriaceae bacterium]